MELEDQTLRHHTRLISTQSLGRTGMIRGCGSSSVAQNGNPLQLFTRQLHGFNLHMIANAELVDGHELSAAFQPGPRFDGQGHFPTTCRPRQDD